MKAHEALQAIIDRCKGTVLENEHKSVNYSVAEYQCFAKEKIEVACEIYIAELGHTDDHPNFTDCLAEMMAKIEDYLGEKKQGQPDPTDEPETN